MGVLPAAVAPAVLRRAHADPGAATSGPDRCQHARRAAPAAPARLAGPRHARPAARVDHRPGPGVGAKPAGMARGAAGGLGLAESGPAGGRCLHHAGGDGPADRIVRITFDLSPAVHRHAGLGRYAHELLSAELAAPPEHDYRALYYAPRGQARPDPPLDRLPAQVLRLPAKPWRMSVLLAHLARVHMDRWIQGGDVFHATDHLLPPLRHSRLVFTVHDLIYLFYPQYHLPLNRWYLTLMMPRFLRRAAAIIAVSENTRRDVTRLMGIPAEKIVVIHEGVNPAYHGKIAAGEVARVRQKYHLPARYLLFLGTLEPRKNIGVLLEAYHALLARDDSLPRLVVAGRKGWLFEPVFQKVEALGLGERVSFTDWVPEA